MTRSERAPLPAPCRFAASLSRERVFSNAEMPRTARRGPGRFLEGFPARLWGSAYRGQESGARGISDLLEQFQDQLVVLVGDRQRLDAEMLLGLQAWSWVEAVFMLASTRPETPVA